MKDFHVGTKNLDFVTLYGSQLGQAKSIAESLVDVASQEHDLKTEAFSLNEVTEITDLQKLKCPLVIVTSTTGDGDPPENADKFWRKLRRKTLSSKSLLCLRYTILGLGDTNFNNFCNCGKQIHRRIQELGGTLFYPPGWADDGTGLDIVVDDWIQGLWPALKKSIGIAVKSGDINETVDSFFVKPNSTTAVNNSSNPVKENQKQLNSQLPNTAELENHGVIMEKVTESSPKLESVVPLKTEKKEEQAPAPVVKTLTLPALPASALIAEYSSEPDKSSEGSTTVKYFDPLSPVAAYPLIDGSPLVTKLLNAKLLTKTDAVKTTIQITLGLDENTEPFDFEPGDSVGIVCPNPSAEVRAILKHLDVEEKADLEVSVKVDTNSPKGKIPAHIPIKSTLRTLFTHFCDIRTPPKKAFLRLLAENTSDTSEKNQLLELCSKQGSVPYNSEILNPGVSLLDIFMGFPSCKPKVESLIEHLPRLLPRAFSICSSPLKSSRDFNIAFNVIEIPKENPRFYSRLGLCTGWLYEICKQKFSQSFKNEGNDDSNSNSTINEILVGLDALSLNGVIVNENKLSSSCPAEDSIIIYRRKNQNFRLPSDLTKNIIMIGPGTGVAPFIGFLEHLEIKKKSSKDISFGKSFLYFGNRHKGRDFLYEDEMNEFVSSGVLTKLYTSFSRDGEGGDSPKYVQDLLRCNQEEVVSTLIDEEGFLFVCGDAKNMARDVRETLIACFQNIKGLNEKEAMALIATLVTSKRYLQDVWS